MFFAPEILLGAPPKIMDRHYKIRPSTDHGAKFQAGRPTHLGDLMLGKKNKKTSCVKHKSFRKLSFSGGLKMSSYIQTGDGKVVEPAVSIPGVFIAAVRLFVIGADVTYCQRIRVTRVRHADTWR